MNKSLCRTRVASLLGSIILLSGCAQNGVTHTSRAAILTKLPGRYSGPATIERVIDGDTVELTTGDRVRYLGIDTPETVDPRKAIQCFGHQASEKNRRLVEGKEVRLVADVEDRDAYNRFLRYVYQGDTFVNLELVSQGYAYAYPYPPNVAHEADFQAAQTEARAANRGLWAGCSTNDIAPHLKRPQTN